MNNMVKKLLTLNQLEFGNDVVAMERFDLTALVKNYIQSAAILTKQNEITVRMEEYPPIYAWADEFKIEEVFMNFFSNAVNHCEGEKIIDVKMEQKDGRVRVSVFNTGKPIPEDSIGHIWEKFYKVDKARTREYGGSGVGLSIVKAIMESMNQQFGVINYNNGVEFWFELETKIMILKDIFLYEGRTDAGGTGKGAVSRCGHRGRTGFLNIPWRNWQVWQKLRRRKSWVRSYNGWIM